MVLHVTPSSSTNEGYEGIFIACDQASNPSIFVDDARSSTKVNVVLVVPTVELSTPFYMNVVRCCADESGAWPCKHCTLKPRSRIESNVMFYCVDE